MILFAGASFHLLRSIRGEYCARLNFNLVRSTHGTVFCLLGQSVGVGWMVVRLAGRSVGLLAVCIFDFVCLMPEIMVAAVAATF